MQAGRLRHRVQLQRATDAIDVHGDTTPTWATLATVHASIEPINGREYFLAAQTNAEVTARITIRARRDLALTPKDRVRFGSRLYDIQAVIDREERGREMQLLVIERVT